MTAPAHPSVERQPAVLPEYRLTNVGHSQQILDRISRAAGQLRGVGTMYEEQRRCTDVLDQIAAVRSALDGIALLVVEDHLTGCMTATGESSGAAVSDLLSVLRRYIRIA
jgi:DNA-binding FrmR family transcriptional regulator